MIIKIIFISFIWIKLISGLEKGENDVNSTKYKRKVTGIIGVGSHLMDDEPYNIDALTDSPYVMRNFFNSRQIEEKILRRELEDPEDDYSDEEEVGLKIENYPYVVSVQPRTKKDCLFVGTIITQYIILTDAFSAKYYNIDDDPYDYAVLAGTSNCKREDDNSQRTGIESVIIHPDFKRTNPGRKYGVNNLALLILSGRLIFSNSIRRITLTPPGCRRVETFYPCQTVGWGQTVRNNETSDFSKLLESVPVEIMNTNECKKKLDMIELRVDDQFCTKSTDGFCLKNELNIGVPIVCYGVMFGWLSYGSNCDELGSPMVWSKVSVYWKWIHDNIPLKFTPGERKKKGRYPSFSNNRSNNLKNYQILYFMYFISRFTLYCW